MIFDILNDSTSGRDKGSYNVKLDITYSWMLVVACTFVQTTRIKQTSMNKKKAILKITTSTPFKPTRHMLARNAWLRQYTFTRYEQQDSTNRSLNTQILEAYGPPTTLVHK